jgi:hypothetical protein
METLEIHNQAEYEANINFEGIFVIRNPTEVITLRGFSSAELWGSSSSELWGSSRAELRESSSAELRGSSSAVLRESSRAELRGSSSAELWGSSSADALDNATILTHGDNPVRCFGNATSKPWIEPVYDRSILDVLPAHDSDSLVLYKSVNPETFCDFYSGKIKYVVGEEVEAPDWDPDPDRQCGGGLHLCFSALGTLAYNRGTILKCLAAPEDVVVYKGDVSKVRCRKVHVVGVIDIMDKGGY